MTRMNEERMKLHQDFKQAAKVKVLGIGGGGGNAVNRMVLSQIKGVDFIALNTDAQSLRASVAPQRYQLGEKLTRGLGVGGDPEKGRQAAEESKEQIKEILKGTDMVFLTAGLGGGTGTGALPVVAELARQEGILTVGVVTKPFEFEGKTRGFVAEEGLKKIKDSVDTLIIIPNQRLLAVVEKDTTLLDAFRQVDDVLRLAVQGISDIITKSGHINVDFADVRTILRGAGRALMGTGTASGVGRAQTAVISAIHSPLLENLSVEGATKVLANITAGNDFTFNEFEEIMKAINKCTSAEESNIIMGTVIEPELKEEIKLTVIATGFTGRKKVFPFKDKNLPEKIDLQLISLKKSFEDVDLNIPAYMRKRKEEEQFH